MRVSVTSPSVILLVAFSAYGSDWPCYRGPHGDGTVDDKGLLMNWSAGGLDLVWSQPLPDNGDASHAGPAVGRGRVYVPTRIEKQDVLLCFDGANGAELWRYAWPAPTKNVSYGTGVRATPTLYDKYVYVLTCFGQLLCLEADKGVLLWQRDLVADFGGTLPPFGSSAAVLVVDGRLICQPGGKGASLVALEPATGKEIWRSGDDENSYAAPELVELCGVRQILAYPGSGLVAHDIQTGKELWRYAYADERDKNIPGPLVAGDCVYFANNTLGFSALQVANNAGNWTVSRLWSARDQKMHYSSPVLGEGCLYFHNSKREIRCLGLKNGGELWATRKMGVQYGMLLRLENNRLLTVNDDGQAVLLEVSAAQIQERGRFQACAGVFPQPAIADGRLYLRDHKTLFCYDLRSAKAGTATATLSSSTLDNSGWRSRWPILANRFIVGWLSAVALAVLGVLLLHRGQGIASFLAIEWATVGVVSAMLLRGLYAAKSHFFYSRRFLDLMSVGFAAVVMLTCGIGAVPSSSWKSWRIWMVLLSGAGALLVLHNLPMAEIDITPLLASTTIADTRSTIGDWLIVVPLTLVFAAVTVWQAQWLQSTTGAKRIGWLLVVALLVAIVAGVAVNSLGTLLATALLLVPASAARGFSGALRWQFVISAVLGLTAVTAGFVLADICRVGPAEVAIGLLLGVALLSIGLRCLVLVRNSDRPACS